MPAVNFDVMYQATGRDAKAGPGSNKVVYWSRLCDWKNQTLTPNPDAIYFMPFFDTKDVEAVVLEFRPPSMARSSGPSYARPPRLDTALAQLVVPRVLDRYAVGVTLMTRRKI
jgi:hypothetical protein